MGHRTYRRAATALAVILGLPCTALPAQQQSAGDRASAVAAAGESAPPPSGPRLPPEWRRVEPRLSGSEATNAYHKKDSITIRMSTLVLVLCVIILVLLIA